MTDTIQLPHVLSELAQMALDDVTVIDQREGFVVCMGDWYTTDDNVGCAVCAAGSVMVQRLGMRGVGALCSYSAIEVKFGRHNMLALLAIDMLRRGWVGDALMVLDQDPETLGGELHWEAASWNGRHAGHPLNRDLALAEDADDIDAHRDGEGNVYGLPDLTDWCAGMAELIVDLRSANL